MRVGPFEIRRHVTAAQSTRTSREIGASGTVIQDGYLQVDEYNNALRWPQSLAVYKQMRRSDASVREAEQHIFAPIMNATWAVEPGGEDFDDLACAAALEEALFGDWLAQPWSEFLYQALTFLSTGYQVFELPQQVIDAEVEVEVPDGDPRILPTRPYLTVRRFAQRLPETVWRWNMKQGDLVSVVQHAFKDDEWGEWEIPADQLLVLTNQREGDDLTGVSVLRTAYKPWYMKELVEKIAGIAVERHGIGTWLCFTGDMYRNDDAVVNRLEDIFTAIGLGDAKYAIIPAAEANGQRDGVTVRLETPSNQLPDLVKLLEYFRGEIKGNVLARFAELGHGSVGARATGDVQSEVWYDALHAVARHICDALNTSVLGRFQRENFPSARPPKLTVEDIESRSLQEFAESNAKLVAAGAVAVDRGYRSFVRRGMGAPEEDDPDEADELLEPEEPDEDEPPASGAEPDADESEIEEE